MVYQKELRMAKLHNIKVFMSGVVLTLLSLSLTANYYMWEDRKPKTQQVVLQKDNKPVKLSLADLE